MVSAEIVKRYVDAWNQQDVSSLLDLMHAGAAYHDAFWMETCVGPDLAQYFRDTMQEEPFWYEQVGELIAEEQTVVFRYRALSRRGSGTGRQLYFGAEILNILDGKILTVTDVYCSPNRSDLKELAELAARRHGLATHVNYGLSAMKSARIKAGLLDSIEHEKAYLDPGVTIAELAAAIGCTIDQLQIVIERQFGSDFCELLDAKRVEYARELLERSPNDSNAVERAASSAGFKSVREFREKFAEIVGVTPTDFCARQRHQKDTEDNPRRH